MKGKHTWIIGASSGLGRQIAESLAAKGVSVVLSARQIRDLQSNCKHIRNTCNVQSYDFPFDLSEIKIENDAQALIDDFTQKFGFPEAIYVLSGAIIESDADLMAATCLPQLMAVNFMGPSLLISCLVRNRPKDRKIRVVVASSVAAIRPRRKNISYGTAKKSLEQFCMGLLHSPATVGVKIQIIRFGYMDTNMCYGQKLPFHAAKLTSIVNRLTALEHKSSGLYYAPAFWYLIAIVLKSIPFFIYKKLKF
jgi:decaprenylphospho-beta-D-erythro-pentofuranosid-2-ulose 2-reductase